MQALLGGPRCLVETAGSQTLSLVRQTFGLSQFFFRLQRGYSDSHSEPQFVHRPAQN
jgi:hypothetical protein